jgi:hypothetical protein
MVTHNNGVNWNEAFILRNRTGILRVKTLLFRWLRSPDIVSLVEVIILRTVKGYFVVTNID